MKKNSWLQLLAIAVLAMALVACPSPVQPGADDGTDNPTVDTPTPSSEASLSALSVTVGGAALPIGFQASTYTYSVNVQTTVASVLIAATAADAGATVVGTGTVALGAAGTDTACGVVVTAADGTTKKTYTVTVHRASADASTDASLSALSVSIMGDSVPLDPGFDAAIDSYSLPEMPFEISVLTVSATATDDGAAVAGGGDVPLSVGANEIAIVVTAEDGATVRTYTLDVTRYGRESTNLASVSLSGISTLSFDPVDDQYELTAPYALTSTVITAAAEYPGSTIRLDTDQDGTYESDFVSGVTAITLGEPGETVSFEFEVTAEYSGATGYYSFDITRAAESASNVAALETLYLRYHADPIATQHPDTLTYSATVPSFVSEVTVDAVASDGGSVAGDGDRALELGANELQLTVTAADGITTAVYTINVTRLAPPTLSITAPTAGAVVDLEASTNLTVSGTFDDPNGEVDGVTVLIGSNQVEATVTGATFSASVDLSGMTNGTKNILVFATNDGYYGGDTPIALATSSITVTGGAEGYDLSFSIALPPGLASLEAGYLSIALIDPDTGATAALTLDIPCSTITFPYAYGFEGVASGSYDLMIMVTDEPYLESGGSLSYGYQSNDTIVIDGADLALGTVYLMEM